MHKNKKNLKKKSQERERIFQLSCLGFNILITVLLCILIWKAYLTVPKTDDKTYLFVGDSITHRYNLEKYYPDLSVINSGVEANKTEDILNDINYRIYQYHPDVVILLIGINQIERDSESKIIDDIKEIVRQINAFDNNITVYIQSLYPINNQIENSAAMTKNNQKIKKVNMLLEEYCRDNQVGYINVYDSLLDEDGNLNTLYTMDGLHVNDVAYQIITNIIKKNIK